MSELTELNPIYGPFFGVMGAASAMIFSGNLIFFYLIFKTGFTFGTVIE
jgi:hypothetical protein